MQSWNIGIQRELDKNTVVEFRFTGNHGTKLWRLYGLNEINIFENGILTLCLREQGEAKDRPTEIKIDDKTVIFRLQLQPRK